MLVHHCLSLSYWHLSVWRRGLTLDVAVSGLWGSRFERTLLDIRVFNPHARSNRSAPHTTVYRRHEKEKRRCYEERVREVEHATFMPVVLSASGGMGRAATSLYRRIALLRAERRKEQYSHVISSAAVWHRRAPQAKDPYYDLALLEWSGKQCTASPSGASQYSNNARTTQLGPSSAQICLQSRPRPSNRSRVHFMEHPAIRRAWYYPVPPVQTSLPPVLSC